MMAPITSKRHGRKHAESLNLTKFVRDSKGRDLGRSANLSHNNRSVHARENGLESIAAVPGDDTLSEYGKTLFQIAADIQGSASESEDGVPFRRDKTKRKRDTPNTPNMLATLLEPRLATIDEDDGDWDMKEASEMIDSITPTLAGFQAHILKLNPNLASVNNYLVNRIGHQQIVRYKALLKLKLKHLRQVRNHRCSCGSMCQATILNNGNELRGVDPLLAGSDEDGRLLEVGIITKSFPQDISMPLVCGLPAEFECPLCFQCKKFQTPSDWTNHVRKDIQPFTCTWDGCKVNIFHSKSHWVRHENEGHRHLQWWACNVGSCLITCYRRPRFLRHLVLKHAFAEPKHTDTSDNHPTLQKVQECHSVTRKRPQEEPCRFCGKTFSTWAKLTEHMAEHMEQISLPIIRLVNQGQWYYNAAGQLKHRAVNGHFSNKMSNFLSGSPAPQAIKKGKHHGGDNERKSKRRKTDNAKGVSAKAGSPSDNGAGSELPMLEQKEEPKSPATNREETLPATGSGSGSPTLGQGAERALGTTSTAVPLPPSSSGNAPRGNRTPLPTGHRISAYQIEEQVGR